jgi:tetratricopeptide (TPR) repeat protein
MSLRRAVSIACPALLAIAFQVADPVFADDARQAFQKASVAMKAGRFDEAVAEYARAESLATSATGKANAANGAGHVFMKLRRYAEAIPHFERAVATDPRSKVAWNNLGLCHLSRYEGGLSGTESLAAALEAFHTTAGLDPAFHPEHLRAAQDDADREQACAGLLGVPPQAGVSATLVEPVAATGTFTAYRKAGEAAEVSCQWAIAADNYTRAEALGTTKRSACAAANLLGLLALRTRQPQAAVDHLRRATVADPSNKYAWNNLGVACMRLYDAGTGGKELVEQAVDAFQHVGTIDAAYKPDNLAWSRGVLTELGGPTVTATEFANSGTVSTDASPARSGTQSSPAFGGTQSSPAPHSP